MDAFSSVLIREPLDRQIRATHMEKVVVHRFSERKVLESLDTSSAAGPDNIHSMLLKFYAEQLFLPITIIFQKSLRSEVLPELWL